MEMEVDSNQDSNTIDAFLNYFEQWKLECQREYLENVKGVFENPEAREILFDLKSYIGRYLKLKDKEEDDDDNILELLELIVKPIDKISKSEVLSGYPGNDFVNFGKVGFLLHEEKQRRMEKILENHNILKNNSPKYRKNIIYSCAVCALNAISQQESMKEVINGHNFCINHIDMSFKVGIVQAKDMLFDNLDVNSVLNQNTNKLFSYSDNDIDFYVEDEKCGVILKKMLACPDFVKLIDNFDIGTNNGIWNALNSRIIIEDRHIVSSKPISKKELNLLNVFSNFRYMSYSNIKKSITESGLEKSIRKKLYKMMLYNCDRFCIFENAKDLMSMYADAVLSFQEVIQIFASRCDREKCICIDDSNDLLWYEMGVFGDIFNRYLRHDYGAYLENNQSEYNTYKTLQNAVLGTIDIIAKENKIPDKRVNVFKEMIEDAFRVNIFGVIIQFIENLFFRLENKEGICSYSNIKLDRLASNIMEVLPKILASIYRNDNAIIANKDEEKEIKDKDIQIEEVVSIEENNIIPKQASDINANNIDVDNNIDEFE